MLLELTVSNQFDQIHRAVESVGAWLEAHPDLDWAKTLALLAVEEVGTNFAKYAHPTGDTGFLSIRLELIDERRLVAVFEDRGVPFNPLLQAPPNTEVPLAEREPGGLGIPILRKWSDGIEYHRVGDSNRLELWKTRP